MKLSEKNFEALNDKVSSDIQALYDRMSLLYPCRWDNVTIVILDEYVIKPPYEEVVYKNSGTAGTAATNDGGTPATAASGGGGGGGSTEALDRIVKIVSDAIFHSVYSCSIISLHTYIRYALYYYYWF